MGFKVSLTLVETLKNYVDIVPDYKSYYNAWNALETTAIKSAETFNSSETNKLFDASYLDNGDSLSQNLATIKANLALAQSDLETSIKANTAAATALENAQTAYNDYLAKYTTLSQLYNAITSTSSYSTILSKSYITDYATAMANYKTAFESGDTDAQSLYADEASQNSDLFTTSFSSLPMTAYYTQATSMSLSYTTATNDVSQYSSNDDFINTVRSALGASEDQLSTLEGNVNSAKLNKNKTADAVSVNTSSVSAYEEYLGDAT